ncbi:RagB/SusD family nutrient uptake outer membrane protein [Longibacter salinarum]|uniref:RagB/SusD family nutrient uptake outer membrane protein n=1 Tax=Longibacter salinarum TaxID=1850348 RepID=A0A2A8CXQ6_9BACT|nr:RagB/SusD family nutrient uptake outer membrane protein [Longibacter salinarum]PEN13436.1 RagB/SusD family nutrient uptake outer membrane protein [Longibacter salinarum]
MNNFTRGRFTPLLSLLLLLTLGIGFTACDNVAVEPKGLAAADNIFKEEGAYKSYLAKLYAGLNVTGQQGPAGSGDIANIDEGFSQYIRLYWQMQELPTDEAVIAYSDGSVQELNTGTWSSSNGFSSAMYSRIFFQVAHANEFLRQSTGDLLQQRGVDRSVINKMPQWRAEARFLRALSYYHGIDLFGDIPLVDESVTRGGAPPAQASRTEVFEFIEGELLDIVDDNTAETLPDARQGQYGRADKGAAWMLLAKLYLNADVYLDGQAGSVVNGDPATLAAEYAARVIDAGYQLEADYQHLFLADNHTADGVVFAIPNDGQNTQHYGGTQFLTHAAVGGSMTPADYGIDFGYQGLRTTEVGYNLFGPGDSRGIFYTNGQSLEIDTLTVFTDGYAVPKYQNVTSNGVSGANATFPDTDYPMFRLAEAHLIYAEAVQLRGGSSSSYDPATLINDLRARAGVSSNLSNADLTEDFLLAERGRELFWEAKRRTDLVRFGKFGGQTQYTWPFKGDDVDGGSLDETRNLYPLPANELSANPNLEQNPGY